MKNVQFEARWGESGVVYVSRSELKWQESQSSNDLHFIGLCETL